MTVLGATCSACGRVAFPPRLVCQCGEIAWVDTVLSAGYVESLTTLRADSRRPRSSPVVLATVRTPEGAAVITRADTCLEGDTVRIDFEADVLWARPIPT
jgi:uncharacterized OB-fold protein